MNPKLHIDLVNDTIPTFIYDFIFNNPALIATTIVLTVMSPAPAAGLSRIPCLYSTPAARGRVAIHQHDTCRFRRHLAATADGNPNIRLGQRRRIIDAISCHRDKLPGDLQFLYLLQLLIRQHLRYITVHAQRIAYTFGHFTVIARQQYRSNMIFFNVFTAIADSGRI